MKKSEKNELIEKIRKEARNRVEAAFVETIVDMIVDMPANSRETEETGYWVDVDGVPVPSSDTGSPVTDAWCSECDMYLSGSKYGSADGRFCPYCGIKMKYGNETR